MRAVFTDRLLRRALIAIAAGGLAAGLAALGIGRAGLAGLLWSITVAPVALALLVSMSSR
jgi:hypothetical protein